jgi:hypothetical protein
MGLSSILVVLRDGEIVAPLLDAALRHLLWESDEVMR